MIVFVIAREAWQAGIAVATELLHIVERVVVGGVGGDIGKICLDLGVIPEQTIPTFTHIGSIDRFRKASHTGTLSRAVLVCACSLWRATIAGVVARSGGDVIDWTRRACSRSTRAVTERPSQADVILTGRRARARGGPRGRFISSLHRAGLARVARLVHVLTYGSRFLMG